MHMIADEGSVLSMKQLLFRGMATALVTPMHPDGSVDLQTLARLTEWQIQSGAAALVPCGTTGEAATLTLRYPYRGGHRFRSGTGYRRGRL